MGKRKHSLLSDLSFQAIILLMFIAILYLSFDHANLVENGIILCMVMILLIVTYFTSLRTGLIMNVLFTFLLIAYAALRAVEQGNRITGNIYFWMFWPTGMIIGVACFMKEHRQLDKENKIMQENLGKFATIDEQTQLNNLLGFERDAAIYMNISRRYELELVLVLWKLTYQENLKRLLGKEAMKKAVEKISDSIKESLRREDLVYFVDNDPYIWGTLLFTKYSSADLVIQHVKFAVAETDMTEVTSQKDYSLSMFGVAISYKGSSITPLAFLNKAKIQLKRKEYASDNPEDFLPSIDKGQHGR